MPSISHRADLSQGFLRRAMSWLAALPAGTIRGAARWFAQRFEDWRDLRALGELDEHILRDIGLTDAEGRGSFGVQARRARKLKQ
jgi:uncharacterized protein YjiS (DUF1127 family)